jgi:hypothetical protein
MLGASTSWIPSIWKHYCFSNCIISCIDCCGATISSCLLKLLVMVLDIYEQVQTLISSKSTWSTSSCI